MSERERERERERELGCEKKRAGVIDRERGRQSRMREKSGYERRKRGGRG